MKAIRKSDGKVIEVTEKSSRYKEKIYIANGIFYRKEELDFNVEKSEEVTIDGWVARDKCGDIFLYGNKPIRKNRVWIDNAGPTLSLLPHTSFPSLTWDSDPIEATITIKPKKQ